MLASSQALPWDWGFRGLELSLEEATLLPTVSLLSSLCYETPHPAHRLMGQVPATEPHTQGLGSSPSGCPMGLTAD